MSTQPSFTPFPENRMAWFESARFGMFIHWGLYSLIGRGEWVMNRERIPLEEYKKLADQFTASGCNPKEWAQLAKDAGMKYMVLTTKHHEGFCLWDSKTCSFNSVNSAAKRDLVKEFVEAAREAGLKVGLYYSLGDWLNPDWTRGWQGDEEAKSRFMNYTHSLVRELLTGYGKIDILWYDLPQCYSPAEWRSVELNAMARQLQPHILINNRALTNEDFGTPEQHATATSLGRMWEACMTLNRRWGYCPSDRDYKSPKEVVLTLASVAGGAGNLLLNVGPDGEGRIPEESARILRRTGEWLRVHGESIYGTNRHNLLWNLWGPITVKGNTLFIHQEVYFGKELVIGGLTNQVLNATLLTTGQPLRVEKKGDQTIISGLPEQSPDELVSVIKLELDGEPDQDISRVINKADIAPEFPN
jgi:alpha-L-fucosidase